MQGRTRLIIVRFVSQEDRNLVWAKRGKIKQSTVHPDAYITEDFGRILQEERKVLIKAMIKARDELGLDNIKVIGRYLTIDNQKYDYNTIPDDLKCFFPFSMNCKMEISVPFLTRGYAKRRNGFLLGLRYANVSLAHSGVESS